MIPYLVLASHIALAVVVLSLALGINRGFTRWIGRNSLLLGLLVSASAVVGSLYYSNIVGYPPCNLCWWQRIFIFPTLPILIVAFWRNDSGVWKYIVPLAAIGALISVYHLFVQAGLSSILPCPVDAACDRLYVFEFGYISIPAMALTISAAFLILAWARKKYD